MPNSCLWEQILCRWREFTREPASIFWVIVMPVVWMLGLGYAFSEKKSETYAIGWPSSPAAATAPAIANALAANSQIKLKSGSPDELMTLMKRGQITIIVTPQDKGIQVKLDAANPDAQRALAFVNDLVQRSAGRIDPLVVNEVPVEVKGGRYIDFLLPGILGMSIMSSSLFGVGMSIVSDRREKLLRRFLVTPMKAWQYILSHIIGRFVILAAEFTSIMLCGHFIFGFVVYGNFLSYIALVVLGASSFTSLALLCASRAHSMAMISGIINLITLPMIMLSGVFFSKSNLPDWLARIVDYLPLTALVDALRKVALEGQGLLSLHFEIGVMGCCLVATATTAAVAFLWR